MKDRAFAKSLALLLAIAVSGCGDRSRQPANESSVITDKPARSEVERGPVRVTVEVDPNPARLSDEPTLTVTMDYEKGVQLREPPFGDAIGGFTIRDFRQPLPKSSGDREIIQQIYTLEPTQSGELQIDPIVVTFTDDRPDGDGKEHTIETEAITVTVESVLQSDLPSLDDLQPAVGPVELPGRTMWFWPWLGMSLLVLVVASAVYWRYRGRTPESMEPQFSPREMAYLELEQLLESGLAERAVKEFYVELTGIVRLYIERTTRVHAPEQTTEEFLYEISQRDVFPLGEQQRLKDFLESADLVKYAAHQPQPSDVEDMFNRAKAFIGLEQLSEAAA